MMEFFDFILNVGLLHYLFVALILFLIGLFGAICSRNLIKVLLCIELMLNAVGINFVAFAYYVDAIAVQGMIFNLFVIAIGACEIAVATAIIFAVFKYKKDIDTENIKELKG